MSSPRSRKAAALAAVLAVFCLLLPAADPQERPTSPELAALLPKPAAWTPSEAPRTFFPDDLFEYINGAAESYLSYDFRELLVADLEKKGSGATLTLEIYDMGLPVNAFGIFAAERYPENKPVALGDLGYLEGEALNFLAGRFYVKMLAFGLGDATESALTEVGAKVAGAIKPGSGLPALVTAFPTDGLVVRSEKYVKKNFMGYEFLRDGYVATYVSGGREMEGFFVDGGYGAGGRSDADEARRGPEVRRADRGEDRRRRPRPEPLRAASLHRAGRGRSLRRDARPGRARAGGGGAPPDPDGRPRRRPPDPEVRPA